jgi:hypothetical protein
MPGKVGVEMNDIKLIASYRKQFNSRHCQTRRASRKGKVVGFDWIP